MQGHIVITGATGVIGAELVLKLINRGEKVVLLSRSPESAARQISGAAGYVKWDPYMESGEWSGFINGAFMTALPLRSCAGALTVAVSVRQDHFIIR